MKARLLNFINYLKENVELVFWGKALVWILTILITAYCLILLALPLHTTSAPKGIVFAKDNDGGRAIETSMATRWYNSNHFAPYGNLYYRLSHTLADLVPLQDSSLPAIEAREKSHDFALKLISLFSLFSLGLYLAYLLFGLTPTGVLFATFFTLVSLNIDMWVEWVFRPHPEHLLNLLTAVAVFAFARLLARPGDERIFILSAFAWGLAMAVKRSTGAFVPGILLLLLYPFSRASAVRTAKYVGLMLFSYLLIGFPQNFGFYKHIKFLLYESSMHSVADVDTFVRTAGLVWEQLWVLAIPVAIGVLLSKKREKAFTVKLVIFLILGALPILLRKLSFPGDHHTMPTAVACLVAILVLGLHFLPVLPVKRIELLLFPVLIFALKWHGIPKSYAVMEKKQSSCAKEMKELISIVGAKVGPEFRFLREPFFPSNSEIEKFSKVKWGLRLKNLSKETGFVGVSDFSYRDYHLAPPTTFYGKRLEGWKEKSEFYNTLRGKDSFEAAGNEYKKRYSACGYELWERTSAE